MVTELLGDKALFTIGSLWPTFGPSEDLLELIMRRYERASALLTSNRPVDDWGKLLGDTAAARR